MTQPERIQQNGDHNQDATTKVTERSSRKDLVLLAMVLGVPLTVGGVIGLVVGHELGEQEGRKRLDDIFGKDVRRPFDPNLLNTQPDANLKIDNINLEILLFDDKTENLNRTFYEFARRPNVDKSLATFHQIAIEHLFDGLRIVKQLYGSNTIEYLQKSNGATVKLDSHVFNLNNPLQFQMAFSLTTLRLNAIGIQQNLEGATYEDSKSDFLERKVQNRLDQEAILWLADQKLTTGFTENSVLFINPESLARFARTLRLLNQLGYPNPRIGLLGPDAQAGGRFVNKGYYASNHTIIDHIDRFDSGSVDSLPHELGHYIAEISAKIKPEFSQSAFNTLMDGVEAANLPLVTNKNEVHFYVPAKYREKRHEQYAYFFAEFVNNGEKLRKKIAKIRQEDPFAANISDVEYDFFKRLFKDKELIVDSLTKEELQSQIEKDRPVAEKQKSYQVDQRVIINDKDVNYPGVLLRPSPAGHITTDTKAVFDGDDVQILEGPSIVKRQTWDQQGKPITVDINWWKVRIYFQEELGRTKIGNQRGAEGWISEEWLGEIQK